MSKTIAVVLLAVSLRAVGQGTASTGQVDATALVRRAIQHRVEESRNHKPLRYLLHEIDERGDRTKEVIETKDGDVDRVIAIDGKPLSPDAERMQIARLDGFASHPERQAARLKNERKNRATMDHLTAMVPDAFVYKLESVDGCATGECYRLTFVPNPKWSPPDFESRLFRGVSGEAWIDLKQERLVRIQAQIIANVDFGFGILGRVNKGGTVLAEQRDIGGGDWELTNLKVSVSGRLLLVKSFVRQLSEEVSNIRQAPPMGYREAIAVLKQENSGTAGQ